MSAFVNDYLGRNLQIAETDVQNAYEAHKADYVEPPAIKVEAIAVDNESAKKDASAALDAGTEFAKVREKHSTLRATPDSPDPFDQWLTRDDRVPLVSDSKAALAHLLSLEKGEVSKRWFEGAGGKWVRFRLADRRAERQLSLAECRDRVERDLRSRKQEDLIKQLQQSLRAKYKVVVHDEKATKDPSDGATTGRPTTRK